MTGLLNARAYRWGMALGMALALVAPSSPALADTADANRTAAEALFGEARKLMAEENYEAACPKLADSQQLDPAIGTLLNLGLCYRHLGRTASAWSAYREAAAMARAADQEERYEVAQREADAIEPRLSRLTLAVDPTSAPEKLELRLDGALIPETLWGVAAPLDPGEHVVEATAPGKLPWIQSIEIGEQDSQTLDVPELEDAPPEPEEPPASPAKVTPVAPAPPEDKPALNGQQIIALGVGGVGVVSAVVGSIFGLSAMSALDDSDTMCSSRNVCTDEGISRREDAMSHAAASTIAYGISLATLGGAAALWFTSPRTQEAVAAPRRSGVNALVAPGIGNEPWSLAVRGRW